MLKTDLVDKFQIAANKDKVIFDSFQHILVMLNNNLRLQFIETYLREGAESQNYENLKGSLYQQGAKQMDVIELIVTAELYGNLDNFYRKNPATRH